MNVVELSFLGIRGKASCGGGSGELIDICVRRLINRERDDREQVFWMEISLLSTLKHKNLVSLVGFCDDNDEKVIIYKNETRGRLDNYLSDPMLLTWVRRLEICVSLAHALSYIHYEEPRYFSVIHRMLSSATILLNERNVKEERLQRPSIDEIVPRLEKALELQLERENASNEHTIDAADTSSTRQKRDTLLIIERKDGEQQFWMEISLLSTLKHKNLVSLVGFCDDNDEKVIIYKNETRGKLDNYLSDPMLLTWVRRLEICVSLAHALSYIHYEEPRYFSVIHRMLSSATILLNDDWEPKLFYFGYCMKIKASQRHHSFHTNTFEYVNGYGDPTYIETKSVNHKSDMYSFGIVLFELLCGRRSIITNDQDNKYLVPVALFHHREKILNDIVDPNLYKQMDQQSFNIFVKAAHDCLKEERLQRPSIDEIVPRLEKALELQLERENASNEHTIDAADTSSTRQKEKNLEHLKIGLADIMLATENLDEKYCIGFGGYGKVYKAQLEHFDSSICSSIEWVNKCDLPKRRSTVAIKHIFNPEGEQGFNVEIETLSSCKHDNIISLLGFCDEGPDHKFLIYELASRGSLENSVTKLGFVVWVGHKNIEKLENLRRDN
ncbi:kinase-like domain, phloem protein 2-like protein, partial [Tanacetum coccineum]